MALFGGRRNQLQRIQLSKWRNDEEKRQLLAEVREGLKVSDAIGLIFHEDAAVRQLGSEAFIGQANVANAAALAKEMGAKPSSQRTFCGKVFSRLPEEIVSPVVEQLLGDKNSKAVRLGWEVALSLGGAVGIKYLQRAVDEAPVVMRGAAMRRLLQLARPDQIVETLIKAASSEDGRLASAAIGAVAKVQDPRVMDLMLDRFKNGDATVRDHAVRWLTQAAAEQSGALRKHMMVVLSEGDDGIRRQTIQILLKTGDPESVIIEILEFLNELLGWLRTRIIETLQTFGDAVLRPAVSLLRHDNEDIRAAALQLAESFHDPRLVGPLCRLLKDEDWWLKVTACDSLAQLGDDRAVPYLIEALDDEDCSWAAVDALAQIGSPASLTPLARMLKDKRPELRLEVIRAFSRFADERLIKLLQVVKDEDSSTDVRNRAAEVLRDMAARMKISISNTEAASAVDSDAFENPMDRLLAKMRELGASDLHVAPNEPPLWRDQGKLVRMEDEAALTPEQSKAYVLSVLSEKQRKIFLETSEIDFCYSVPNVGRYRANGYLQRLGYGATFRAIPNIPPTFADLRLPGHLTELLDYHQGIIVVSGPSGSGKSTTLAALVNLINDTKPTHVLTLEEPVEFVHPVKTALVNQREIGKHSVSFERALRGALREDPDVIMVGELRDAEVIRMALEAAETGHVVITTMHTTSAIQTIERLVGAFPPQEQQQVRMGLSESLKMIICQQLLPAKAGGRTAVFEILKGTFSVGNMIRDDKTDQISSAMQIGRNLGMQSFDMAMMEMVEADVITPEVAWARAKKPATFAPLCPPEFLESQTAEADS